MAKWFAKRPRTILGSGFVLGLLVGVGMLVGSWATMAWQQAPQFPFPETALHAVATDSGETFSMCTGYIADGVEGVFFLDFLTGELQCWVLNNRTGQMGGYFAHNVVLELGVEQGRKNPRYLMVTGQALLQRGTAGFRPSDCVVYVADATSGNFAAYIIPWNRNATAANVGQAAPMKLVFKGSARNLEIRGQ